MCDRTLLEPILREHALAFAPLDNAWVQSQLGTDDVYVRATKARCDCGTPLGAARGRRTREEGGHDVRRIEELRKKGWSSTKIERWLAQQVKTRDRDTRARAARDQDEVQYLETWRDGLDALARAAGRVGLLLHWYRGGLETERIQILRREPTALAALTTDLLGGIEEDVLYDFRLRG